MFTARSSRDGTNYGHYQVIQHLKVSTNIGHTEHDKFYCSRKDSLNKVSINTQHITLTEASIVHTKMHRNDVAEFLRDGNNLILKLNNGETVLIENFFVVYDKVDSDLVLKKMVVSYTGLMVFLVLREYLGLRSYYLLVRQVGLYCHGLLVVVLLLVASLQPQEVAVEDKTHGQSPLRMKLQVLKIPQLMAMF